MDLRNLSEGLSAAERIVERRRHMERELGCDLSMTEPHPEQIGHADEKNCEQMFGHVPIPVGYAGPLKVTFSSGETTNIHLPLATTEGALVASVNRGCKAVTMSRGVRISSIHHGITRSLAFRITEDKKSFIKTLRDRENEWRKIAESTSQHLKVLSYDLDQHSDYIFLTLACDTDEAMGMNMVTIAAQAVGEWIQEQQPSVTFVTVAGNVDSDKKPSRRTHDRGRGYEVTVNAVIRNDVIENILKTTPKALMDVADAKLVHGSEVAGAIGKNMHAANIIAALYLATGQDAAHVVEGSLSDTTVSFADDGIKISARLPAVIIGVRGGGTTLPAQSQCLAMILKEKTSLHPSQQLAESMGAAVLAGELSGLAAQASHMLAKAHQKLGR